MEFIVETLATAIDPFMVVIALVGSLFPRTAAGAVLCGVGSGCLYHGLLGALGGGRGFFDEGLAMAIVAAVALTVPAAWARFVYRHQRNIRPFMHK